MVDLMRYSIKSTSTIIPTNHSRILSKLSIHCFSLDTKSTLILASYDSKTIVNSMFNNQTTSIVHP